MVLSGANRWASSSFPSLSFFLPLLIIHLISFFLFLLAAATDIFLSPSFSSSSFPFSKEGDPQMRRALFSSVCVRHHLSEKPSLFTRRDEPKGQGEERLLFICSI